MVEARRVETQHRLDFVRAETVLAQIWLEAFEQEVIEVLGHAVGHHPVRELAVRALEQRAHVER